MTSMNSPSLIVLRCPVDVEVMTSEQTAENQKKINEIAI